MTRWPIWRLLIWLEVWLLTIAGIQHYRPIHPEFVVPLLLAVLPAGGMVGYWALSRGATEMRPRGDERASWVELLIAATATIAAAGWIISWTRQAYAELQRLDALLGQATVIIDLSLNWLSLGACAAALTLDGALAAVHKGVRELLIWTRRSHVAITSLQVVALFGAVYVLTQMPATGTAENAGFFDRARLALHIYEYAKATIFPVQALFAALSIAIVAADTRAP